MGNKRKNRDIILLMFKFICLFFSSIAFLSAQRNQTLFVATPSGLSLREQPNKESKRIELLPYGFLIENIAKDENGWPKSYNPQTIDGYESDWIKVTYNGHTGYIFRGYTIPIPPPKESDTSLLKYINRVWSQPVFVDSFPNTYQFDNDAVIGINYRYLFNSGEIFLVASLEEAHENSIVNLNMTVQQAYLWFYLVQKHFFSWEVVYENITFPTKNIENDSIVIKIRQNDSFGQELEINAMKGAFYYAKFQYQNGRINLIWGGHI